MKMYFGSEQSYKGQLIFKDDHVYEVDSGKGWADKWTKRGGVEVLDGIVTGRSSMDNPFGADPVEKNLPSVEDVKSGGKKPEAKKADAKKADAKKTEPLAPETKDESKLNDKSKEL